MWFTLHCNFDYTVLSRVVLLLTFALEANE